MQARPERQIVSDLIDLGVYMYVQDGELKYRARKGVISDRHRQSVVKYKHEIIDYLQDLQAFESERPDLPELIPNTTDGPVPLSFSQQRLWFIDQLGEGSAQYNMAGHFLIEGQFDETAYRQAMAGLVERHHVLRTCYLESESGVEQHVSERPELLCDVHDCRDVAESDLAALIDAQRQAMASHTFDLTRDAMLKMRALVLSVDETVVLFVTHHIACDGWSLGILARDFRVLYEAARGATAAALPPLPVQYADFAVWQHRWLDDKTLADAKEYWQEAYADMPEVHQLPLDRRRAPRQSFAGAIVRRQLDEQTARDVRSVCLRASVTPFVYLQTLFALFVARWSNQYDIVMGTPVAGRAHKSLESMIGFFVNTLVLRTRVDGSASLGALLEHNRKSVLAAYRYQHIPFERLVEELNPERDTRHNAVVQISFGVIDESQGEGRGGDPQPEESAGTTGSDGDMQIPFELKLEVQVRPDGLVTNWYYRSSLFDAATVARMSDSFTVLLRSANVALLADNATAVDELCMTGPGAETAVLQAAVADSDRYSPLALHRLFETAAAAQPEHDAIVHDNADGRTALSYAALDRAANRLAHHLVSLGAAPERHVVVCLDRSPQLVVALLAVLKTGAAYVPLDSAAPTQRLNSVVANAQPQILLTQADLLERIESSGCAVCVLDDANTQREIAAQNDGPPTLAGQGVSPEHPAYLIYTSGSTGSPKGVVVTHRNVSEFVQQGIASFVDGRGLDGAIVSSSIAFDATVGSLWVGLCSGLTVEVVADDVTALDTLSERLCDGQSNYLFKITPSHLEALTAHDKLTRNADGRHVIVIAGESLFRSALSVWRDTWLPGACLINEYGPTECTVGSTIFELPLDLDSVPGSVTIPIGGPLGETDLYVLNGAMVPQCIGSTGELYIGGTGIARGYARQPALTAARFVPDPFTRNPGGRLYRTGDLVRCLPCGNLEFIGRVDQQVKIRGHRIELGDIESQVLDIEEVKEAAAAVSTVNDETRLTLYVVPRNANVTNDEHAIAKLRGVLFAQLHERLPKAVIPQTIVVLDRMPLNVNGKLDRSALPAPLGHDLARQPYVAPVTETERALCTLWEELLGVARVGVHDNFFALGGHSLAATRLTSAIRHRLDAEVPLRVVFETPTVGGMAGYIDTGAADGARLPAIEVVSRDKPLPLSFAQQRLWFVDQIGQGGVQYNMPGFYVLEGVIDDTAFAGALQDLVERHEVLRTRFVVIDGQPCQAIADNVDVPLRCEDLTGIETDGDRWTAAQALIDEACQKPFDLSRDVMLRVLLMRMSDDVHVMAYTLHHIAGDGISKAILQRDFAALYAGRRTGTPDTLPRLSVQYADYAIWQRRCLTGDAQDQSLAYWREELDALPTVHSLHLDKPRPKHQRHRGRSFNTVIEADIAKGVGELCRQHNATLFMFMHAALTVLLSRLTGETDVVVGSAITGRNVREVENLIGFFVNDLVLRADLSGNPSFAAVLDQQRRKIVDAYSHASVPFEMLVEELKPTRSISHSPLFQIKLDERNPAAADVSLSDLSMTNIGVTSTPTAGEISEEHYVKHDLYVSVAQQPDGLSLYWLYNTDLFSDDTILRFARQFDNLVRSIVADPGQTIGCLDILGADARTALLNNGRGQPLETPAGDCISRLVCAKAAAVPDNLAAVGPDGSLTYAELAADVTALAHYLRSHGVGEGSIVALCLEPSTDVLVGALGVLRAGATYVALDPTAPPERHEMIMQDCACRWVLTQSDLMEEVYFEAARTVPIDRPLRQRLRPADDSAPPDDDDAPPSPQSLAYLSYTSGSTGTPKGVMVSRYGLMEYCQYALSDYYGAAMDGSMVASSYCFDLTKPGLYLPLLAGDCVEFISREGGAVALAEALASTDKDLLLRLTPSHLMVMLPAIGERVMDSAHRFVIGGEVLPKSLYERLRAAFPNARIYNHYGPTEAVIGCSIQPLTDATVAELSHCPIGRAMDGVQLLVLDDTLQLQPVGTAGELYVGGKGLAHGYARRPGLTAERFVPNPYGVEPGERLYRTGDRVRWHADGDGSPTRLEYVDRLDEQVKIRGHRIELGEIAHRLLQLDIVKACTVRANSIDDTNSLVAYLVLENPIDDDVAEESEIIRQKQAVVREVREELLQQLPDYMVPSIYLFLERIPLTPNGKLDHEALPEPQDNDLLRAKYEPPRNECEVALCEIWQDILGLEKIGIDDDFFLLGGHSLLATRVVNAIRERYEVEIPLGSLFEHVTVRALASEVVASVLTVRAQTSETQLAKADDVEEVFFD